MKKILVIGGNGALGKSVVSKFKAAPKWNVMNIDFNSNENADSNYLLKSNLDTDEVIEIKNQQFLSESKIDCIVNVAGGWQGGSLENDNIIESVDNMMKMNLYSSVLAAALAKTCFNDKALLVLTGAQVVKDQMSPFMLGYHLSKQSSHHLADLLKQSKELPEGTKVVTILPNVIDTPANRQNMPDSDFSKWTKPEAIADLIKMWVDSGSYPSEDYYGV